MEGQEALGKPVAGEGDNRAWTQPQMRGDLACRGRALSPEEVQQAPAPGIELPQKRTLVLRPTPRRLYRLGVDSSKRGGHPQAEVGDKAGCVRLRSAEVVVVRRSNGQGFVVFGQVLRVVLFQAVDALEVVAGSVLDQRRQQQREMGKASEIERQQEADQQRQMSRGFSR